jgi:hypothetical protein
MNTLSASEARANLYRLIDQTVESHEPIINFRQSAAMPCCYPRKIGAQFRKPCTYWPCLACVSPSKLAWPSPSRKARRRLSGELGNCLCQASYEGRKEACCEWT